MCIRDSIIRALKQILELHSFSDVSWTAILKNKTYIEQQVLLETRLAIEKIIFMQKESVELLPRSANLRKIQHNLINAYHLNSRSFGEEPYRRLRIY